jgi:hypothetical protein
VSTTEPTQSAIEDYRPDVALTRPRPPHRGHSLSRRPWCIGTRPVALHWGHSVFELWRARTLAASSCSCETWQHSKTNLLAQQDPIREAQLLKLSLWPAGPWPQISDRGG